MVWGFIACQDEPIKTRKLEKSVGWVLLFKISSPQGKVVLKYRVNDFVYLTIIVQTEKAFIEGGACQ
jgi:hypothetical protein